MEDQIQGPVTPGRNPFDPRRSPHSNPGTNYGFPPQPPRHAVSQARSWAPKPSRASLAKKYILQHYAIITVAIIVAAALVVAYVIVSSQTSNAGAIHLVNQPPTAFQIAQQLGCGKFKDTGPAQAGGAVDTGYCFIGSKKYAIDTFVNQDARDSWLEMATKLGVNPKWQTATSVTYPSITS